MTRIRFVTIEVDGGTAAEHFYRTLALDDHVRVRQSEAPTAGFRSFTLSLIAAQPANVDSIMQAGLDAGARLVTPATRSLWGYGGTLQAPDGTICTVASSSKKNRGPAALQIDHLVIQLGVSDVAASKRFYLERGVAVAKGIGRRYVELDTAPVKVALLRRGALAKAAGVPADGSGSHRLAIASDGGTFTDPDGFVWEDSAT